MRKYYIHITLIVLTVILYFAANFQRVAIPGAIFDILQTDLSLSAPFVTSLGAVFMYSYAVSLLICGILVDKFGGIRVLTIGAISFTLGALLFPNTANIFLLYLSRMLLGLGAATFYLSIIPEIKKCFPDKYFSILLSTVILTGYMGGVCANAPFVYITKHFPWQNILNILAVIILIATIVLIFMRFLLGKINTNEHVKFSITPFKEVLSDSFNRHLFLYSGINYGLYYVIQTVIGNKFLVDFLGLSVEKSSVLLSMMIIIAGISGMIMATISTMINNKKVVFMKTVCIMYSIVFAMLSILLLLGIKTKFIIVLMIFIAIGGGMSSILIPFALAYNKYEVRGTSLSIMNFCGFLMVGFFGNLVGFFLNMFPSIQLQNGIIYSSNSYLSIFIAFFVFALIETYASLKVKDLY